jgi:hypothetical protein
MIYFQRNSPQHPFDRRQGDPESQFGCYREEKNSLLLLEIELRFLGCPVTISIELPPALSIIFKAFLKSTTDLLGLLQFHWSPISHHFCCSCWVFSAIISKIIYIYIYI